MALAMSDRSRPRGEDEDFRQFEVLFGDELEELRLIADDHDVTLREVAESYFVIVRGENPMVSHDRLQDELGVDGPDAWNTASVLVDFGEVYRSKEDRWWWIVASEMLAEKCQQRSISLKKYVEMEPDLRPFQDEVSKWYQRRHMHGNLQDRTMREIKVDHGQRLQEMYYPEKPVDPENFHDHQIARYIKTAQDLIVEALNLSY